MFIYLVVEHTIYLKLFVKIVEKIGREHADMSSAKIVRNYFTKWLMFFYTKN